MRWLLQGHALGCWLLLMTTAVYRPVSAFVRAQASQASRGYLHRLQVLPRRDYLFTAAVATTLSVGGIERPDRVRRGILLIRDLHPLSIPYTMRLV